jgi:hypothetical protein
MANERREMKYRRLQLVLILLVVTTLSCGSCGLPGILGLGGGKTDSVVADGFEFTPFVILESPQSTGMKTMWILFAQERLTDEQPDSSVTPFASDVVLTTQEGYEYVGEYSNSLWPPGEWVPAGMPYWRADVILASYESYVEVTVAEGTSGHVLHLTARSGKEREISLPLDGLPVVTQEADRTFPDFSDPWEIVHSAGAQPLFRAKPPESAVFSEGDVADLGSDLEMTLLSAERQDDSAVVTLLFRNLSGGYEVDVPPVTNFWVEDGCLYWRQELDDEGYPVKPLPLGPNQELTKEFEFGIHPEASQVALLVHLSDVDQDVATHLIIVD